MRTVVVGGGPAGAAAAIALARAGARPLLLEREPVAAEKVCGEFLAEDAARALRDLGLDPDRLGAVPIRQAVLGAGRREARLRLPFEAWGLPRATLDAALLARAADAGAELRLGAAVLSADAGPAGWRLRLATGELDAPSLVLATGKHELRGLRRPVRGGSIGVKMPLLGAMPEATIALLACRGGYAGLQPRPGGGANLCAALDPRAPGVVESARSAEAFLRHVADGSHLAETLLAGLQPALARPMTVAGVPYGYLHAGEGPFRVGDQTAVIPSFCGDGVAMALGSGLAASVSVLAGRPARAHHAAWAGAVRGGMRLARLVALLTDHAPRLLVAGAALAPGVVAWSARRTRLGMIKPGTWA
jgi:flavin-dependent dehydrogenase